VNVSFDLYSTNASIGLWKTNLESSFGLYETKLNVDISLGSYATNSSVNNALTNYVSNSYVDNSLAYFIRSTSIGTNLSWSGGVLNATAGSGASLFYVDGSLASRDISINRLYALSTETIGIVIDGGGSAITTGSKGYRQMEKDCRVMEWTLLSSATGSIVIDVKKCNYTDFPTTTSIAGTEKPTISSAIKNQDVA
jgi:hypothetical protein